MQLAPNPPQPTDATMAWRAEADAAAARIQGFLDGIPSQMNWTVQVPWGEGLDERHRIDSCD